MEAHFTRELISFFVGALSGAMAALIGEFFRNWLYRPKLKICEDRPEKDEEFKFSCHSIVIKNLGRSVAKNCHGMITFDNLHQEDVLAEKDIIKLEDIGVSLSKFNIDGKEEFLLKAGDFRRIENELLAWSLIGNPSTIPLAPNVEAMLDVCRFMKGRHGKIQYGDQIHINSEAGWKKVRAAAKKKRYKITIRIVAENAKPVKQHFAIEPSGEWIRFKKLSNTSEGKRGQEKGDILLGKE